MQLICFPGNLDLVNKTKGFFRNAFDAPHSKTDGTVLYGTVKMRPQDRWRQNPYPFSPAILNDRRIILLLRIIEHGTSETIWVMVF